MTRTLASLSAVAVFAASAAAQCFDPAGGASIAASLIQFTGADPVHDEGRSPVTPLGFAFPMAGSAAGTYTDCVIETNGLVYLCNGVDPPFLGNYVYGSLASLAGAAGSGPRIAPFWRDNQAMPTGWDITTRVVPGVSFQVNWINTTNYGATAPARSFSATLHATGVVEYSYDSFTITSSFVGLSVGNAVGAAAVAANLAANPTGGTSSLIHEAFTTAASWDLANRTIRFTPNGLGGWNVATPCTNLPASHTSYGSGCYDLSDSAYQRFADAAVAGPALTGQSVTFTPVGTTYLMGWGGGTFLPVSGGAVNVFATASDDAEAVVTPTLPVPTPQGPQAGLRVHSNGLLSWGTAPQTFPGTSSWMPTAPALLGAANAAIWFWHDYNEAEAGSGRIVREEVVVAGSTLLVVTWNNVENYSSPLAVNPSTTQLQVNLTTGVVKIVFQSIDGNTSSTFGSAHLVGYSPAGASVDAGSLDLATALPLLVPLVNVAAMTLSATPAPVSTASSGTLVTYTQSNIPEAVVSSSLYLGITMLSLGQNAAGADLGFLGMPGCRLYVTSLDITNAFVGATSTQTTTFLVPAGVPYGFQLFAQAAAVIQPGSLPNGQNSFGATVSNGIASLISAF